RCTAARWTSGRATGAAGATRGACSAATSRRAMAGAAGPRPRSSATISTTTAPTRPCPPSVAPPIPLRRRASPATASSGSVSFCTAGSRRPLFLEARPAARPQKLQRAKAGLVVHLVAALDPVPQVDEGQAEAAGVADVVEDHE